MFGMKPSRILSRTIFYLGLGYLSACGWTKGSIQCLDCADLTSLQPSGMPEKSLPEISMASINGKPNHLNETPQVALQLTSELGADDFVQIAVGTSDDGEEVLPWTNVSTATFKDRSFEFKFSSILGLTNNTLYFMKARTGNLRDQFSKVFRLGSWSHTPYMSALIDGTNFASFSYVAIDVDWENKIAYLASREPDKCLTAVDFSNENNPVVVKVIGTTTSPATTGGTCLGLRLYQGGKRLVLSVSGSSHLEVWDLGNDPKLFQWSRLSSIGSVTGARRIQVEYDNQSSTATVYTTLRSGLAIYQITEPTGQISLSQVQDYGANNLNEGVALGQHFVVGRDTSGSAILEANTTDLSDTTLINYSSVDFANGWFWTGSKSVTDSWIYLGGHGGVFLKLNGSQQFEVAARHKLTDGNTIRDSHFVIEDGKNILYTIESTVKRINRWDLSSAQPQLTHSTVIDNSVKEGYGIRVDPTSKRAIVITNGGRFYILHTDNLDPATDAIRQNYSLY